MKKIKLAVGDVFLIPLNHQDSMVFKEGKFEWIPQIGEKVVVSQIIALNKGKIFTPLIAISQKWYEYKEDFLKKLNLDTIKFGFISIVAASDHFIKGGAKRIGNCSVPLNMPFQIYRNIQKSDLLILPFGDAPMNSYKKDISEKISRYGSYLSFDLIISVLNRYHFGIDETQDNMAEHFYDEYLDKMQVKEDNLVSHYYPEAKNNPQWILDQY